MSTTTPRDYRDYLRHAFDIDYSLMEGSLPEPGARFDFDSTAVEYVCEVYFEYIDPTEDDEHTWRLRRSDNDEVFEIDFYDFELTHEHSPVVREAFDGISFEGINWGHLMLMTGDSEGAHIFRHWGI